MSESQNSRSPRARKPQRPQTGRPVQRPSQNAVARSGQRQSLVRPAPKAKSRKARLVAAKIDPWSVLKMTFLLSVALGIVVVVASIVLWTVLDLTGIFDRMNSLLGDIGGASGNSFDVREIASLQQVVSFSTLISLVNIVLLTALSMLAAVLYNICASLVGGIGVTLTDE